MKAPGVFFSLGIIHDDQYRLINSRWAISIWTAEYLTAVLVVPRWISNLKGWSTFALMLLLRPSPSLFSLRNLEEPKQNIISPCACHASSRIPQRVNTHIFDRGCRRATWLRAASRERYSRLRQEVRNQPHRVESGLLAPALYPVILQDYRITDLLCKVTVQQGEREVTSAQLLCGWKSA